MDGYLKIFLHLTITFSVASGARILGVFPFPSISHQIVSRALLTELHSRGHHIFVLTTDPIRNPHMNNYTEIDLSVISDYCKKQFNLAERKESNGGLTSFVSEVLGFGTQICNVLFKIPEVKDFLLQSELQFDVVIVQWFVSPCANGFAHHFSAPLIGFSSHGLFYPRHDAIGNPTHPAYVADIYLPHSCRRTFWERLYSTWYSLWFRWLWHKYTLPEQDFIAKQYFGNSLPYIGDLERNASLVFTNIQSKNTCARPNVPALIELGGLQLRKSAPLPDDLQEFLDGAPEGAIYFSLGTNVRSESLSAAKRQMFLDAFAQLSQYRVLWKWEKDVLPGKPANVKVGKWLPQQDILNHPNIKVFMYQGGLQSTDEAVRAQVPVIGIPFFADQDINVKRLVEDGAGIMMEFKYLSKEIIVNSLKKIIYEPTYKENMKRLSYRMIDQPETSLQRAVWWTEYVIRNKGARHLQSAAIDLTWYQYLLLDVIAFTIITSTTIFWIIHRVARLILCKIKSWNRYLRETWVKNLNDPGLKTE